MIKVFTTPAEQVSATSCDAFGQLPMSSLVTRLIVAATAHANILNIGYENLIADRNVWVLSRMSVEIKRMPRMFEEIVITTWIEDIGRMLSNRNFAISLADGTVLGYVRSLWACINIDTRRPAEIGLKEDLSADRECPIAPIARMRPIAEPERREPVKFVYSDIDLNGHVNSSRYIEQMMNLFDFGFHEKHEIERFDIVYQHEARLDTPAEALIAPEAAQIDIVSGDIKVCQGAFKWKNRN